MHLLEKNPDFGLTTLVIADGKSILVKLQSNNKIKLNTIKIYVYMLNIRSGYVFQK